MTYMTEIEQYGRKEAKIDLPAFAKALAKALDALLTSTDVKLMNGDASGVNYPNEHQAIMVGKDRLDLHANNYKKRVSASLSAPDVKHNDWSTYDKEQRTESASVNPDGRSIEAIARDINKRVIEANQPALAKRRSHAAIQIAARANIVKEAAALKAAVPGLDIRVNEDQQRAQLYGGDRFTGYLSGTLNSDGSVSLERLSGISGETFRKIAKLLEKQGGAE